MLNDSLCCSYKYNWCLCRFIGELYILLLTFLIILSEICIISHEIFRLNYVNDVFFLNWQPCLFTYQQFETSVGTCTCLLIPEDNQWSIYISLFNTSNDTNDNDLKIIYLKGKNPN